VAFVRHAGCVLLGMLVALGAVAVHRSAFPLGLVLALTTTWAVPWRLLLSRWPATVASYVVGWLALFALVIVGRPEGDYVLVGDLPGYALMAGGFVLIVVGIVSIGGSSRRS
jgi:hypothetical protein